MGAEERVGRAAMRAHYDARSPTYDDNAMHRGIAAEVAALVDRAAPEHGVVLDAATGTGLVLRSLRRTDLLRLGVDVSPGMLSVARSADHDLRLLVADAAAPPLPAASVDVVTCVTALHLLPDPAAAFAAWRRVLRDGGLVVTATFSPTGLPVPDAGFPRRHDLVDTAAKLAALAAPAGLDLVAAHETHHPPDRLLVCRLRPSS